MTFGRSRLIPYRSSLLGQPHRVFLYKEPTLEGGWKGTAGFCGPDQVIPNPPSTQMSWPVI